VAAALSVLMTEAPRQSVAAEGKLYHVPTGPRVCVQGAPTSPGLCNTILLRLDHRLAGLARKHGFACTRYADDLTFSGDDKSKVAKLLKLVPTIVAAEGFAINAEKTRIMRSGAAPAGRRRRREHGNRPVAAGAAQAARCIASSEDTSGDRGERGREAAAHGQARVSRHAQQGAGRGAGVAKVLGASSGTVKPATTTFG
jgi:hypothetical protein